MAASKRMKRHHALEKIPFPQLCSTYLSLLTPPPYRLAPSCAPQNGTPRKFQHFAADTFEHACDFSWFCRQFFHLFSRYKNNSWLVALLYVDNVLACFWRIFISKRVVILFQSVAYLNEGYCLKFSRSFHKQIAPNFIAFYLLLHFEIRFII